MEDKMLEYKLVVEVSSPAFIEYKTGKVLYDDYQPSEQRLWLVTWDPETEEIVEWLEDAPIGEEDKLKMKELWHENNGV